MSATQVMGSLSSLGGAVGAGLGSIGGGTVGGLFQPGASSRQSRAGGTSDAGALEQRQRQLLADALALSGRILAAAECDVHDIPLAQSTTFRTRSTVGIMLSECLVENLVVGGPAFLCRQIAHGDKIVAIDGAAVTPETILAQLVGQDEPGSAVTLDLQKQTGEKIQVRLSRMATALIAPKLQLFQTFTECKERALDMKDSAMIKLVESCISAWTEMTIADGEREDKIKCNAVRQRTECVTLSREQEVVLKDIQAVTMDLLASIESMRSNETQIALELEEAKRKLVEMQTLEAKVDERNARIKELELALREAENRNTSLSKEFEAAQSKNLSLISDNGKLSAEISDLNHQVQQLRRQLQHADDRTAQLEGAVAAKSETVSQLEIDLDVNKKEARLIQSALSDAQDVTSALETEKKKLQVQKCSLETDVEGNTLRIRSLEIQLKEAVAGRIHYQNETEALVPAKEEVMRRLVAAELELKSRAEEIDRLTRDNVGARAALEDERTAHGMTSRSLESAQDQQKKDRHDIRLLKTDLDQCKGELSAALAHVKAADANSLRLQGELDASVGELRQAVLKHNALETNAIDLRSQIEECAQTIARLNHELSGKASKLEQSESSVRKARSETEALELSLNEKAERERRLLREVEQLQASLQGEIQKTADTRSCLAQEQASKLLLEKSLVLTQTESQKTHRALKTVEEADRQHQEQLTSLQADHSALRVSMKKEITDLQQQLSLWRVAVERIHHAILPKARKNAISDAEHMELLARLENEACSQAHELHTMLLRHQKEGDALRAKLEELEELRAQMTEVMYSKSCADSDLLEARDTIEKLRAEQARSLADLERLQADAAHDNQLLADDLQKEREENDMFKRLLKASLLAQEQTHTALCGERNSNGGLGMVFQVANGATRVKCVIPGGAADAGEFPILSGDIIEEVDNQSLTGATLTAVQDMLLGPIGSAVNLTLRRSVPPSPRSSTPSVVRPSPRLTVKLHRRDIASNAEAIAERAKNMVAVAGALRTAMAAEEDKVLRLSTSLETEEQAVLALRNEREQREALVKSLEARLRVRDSEMLVIREDANSARKLLQAATLEIESLTQQKAETDERMATSQQRITEVSEENAKLLRVQKTLTDRVETLERDVAASKKLQSEAEDASALAQEERDKAKGRCHKAEDEMREMISLNRQLLDAMKDHRDTLQGVGMTVRVVKGSVSIKDLAPTGGAARCQLLHVGDVVLECDGRPLAGLSSSQVQNMMLGRVGTSVRLKVRSERSGLKDISVVLVRGDDGRTSFADDLRQAIDCVRAMHFEKTQLSTNLKGVLVQTQVREGDVRRTLATVERGFEDARVSWLDVPSSNQSFKLSDEKGDGSNQLEETNGTDTNVPDLTTWDSNRLDVLQTSVEVETGTQRSRIELARVTDLTLESFRQITDLVRVRSQLKEALSQETRLRQDHERIIGNLKADIVAAHDRLDSLAKEYTSVLAERSSAVEFEAKMHAVLRNKEVELVGVGMVVQFQGDKGHTHPVIMSIAPGGAAAACDTLNVGDVILSVDGKNVEGMDAHHLAPLFVGALGSKCTVIASRPQTGRHWHASGSSSSVASLSSTLGGLTHRSLTESVDRTREWFEEIGRDFGGMLSRSSRTTRSQFIQHSFSVTLVRTSHGCVAGSQNVMLLAKDRQESLELARKLSRDMGKIGEELTEAQRGRTAQDDEINRLHEALAQQRTDSERIIQEQRDDLERSAADLLSASTSLDKSKDDLEIQTERACDLARDLKKLQEKAVILSSQVVDLNTELENLRVKLTEATSRATTAEKDGDQVRAILKKMEEDMNSANITIQQLQARVAESAEAVQEVKLNLVVSEAETHKLTKQLETARAESQNQMDRAAKIRAHSDQLEAQVKQRDDLLHELQYKLDLCPYKCKKVQAPAPAPTPTDLDLHLEDDLTKYVGVGMVVRVETGKEYPLIKKIASDGAAAECKEMAIDDALLEVDGKDCRGMTVADMTALFLGPLGSTVTVKGHSLADHEHISSQPSYTVTLVRGKRGQSPKKQALSPDRSVISVAAVAAAKDIGPVQLTADDARVTRALEEVDSLQKELARARAAADEAQRKCTALEEDARVAASLQQDLSRQRESTEGLALSKAEATATALKQELAAKISALDTEMKTSAALKEVSTGVQL